MLNSSTPSKLNVLLRQNKAKEVARQLYDEIASSKIERYVAHIHDCDDKLRGPIVTLEYGMPSGFYKMPSFNAIWQSYGEAITDGDFSLTEGRFHAMTDNEKKWVLEALGQ